MEPQFGLKPSTCHWLIGAGFSIALLGCANDTGADQIEDNGNQSEMSSATPGVDPFCATRPKIEFCEDFDTADLPGAFEEQTSNSSTMMIDESTASSLPRSLIISVEPGGRAQLSQTFEPGGKLRLFGMLYVTELGTGDVEIASFRLGDYQVGFGASEDGRLWAYEGDARLEGNGSLPLGRWASFRWDVNIYDDGTGTANLRFGHDIIVETDQLAPPLGAVDSPVAAVGLSSTSGAWTMQFDTLTVAAGDATQ